MTARDVSFDELREQWEGFGRIDPLWSNLTVPGHDHGRWDVDEFLATGRDEVRRRLEILTEVGIEIVPGRALDFGCGAGRLTQALAEHFERVDGVDIAPSMIEFARAINRQGDRCRFHVNDAQDLSLFESGSFDLVLSMLVLQHMEPRFALRYIREFVRVLRPGGVAMFQVPAAYASPTATPLPAAAWRAEVRIDDPPERLAAGQPAELRVHVRNASPEPWPGDAALGVGAHWRDQSGAFVKIDDGRTPLPHELAPGAEVALSLEVRPPNSAGRVVLEVDVVQERIAWFRERGSEPARTPVEVAADGSDPAREPADAVRFEPWIDMNFVAPEEVAAVVEASGGELVTRLPDDSAGDDFESYVYVVQPSLSLGVRAALKRLADAVAAVPDDHDILPPLRSNRSGRARRAELWLKRRIARATRWFTTSQVEHDRAVARALAEIETVLLVQEQELRRLRDRLGGDG